MRDLPLSRYGLDDVVAWPRLYPLLAAPVRAVVDDQRDALDVNARFCAGFLAAAVIAVDLHRFTLLEALHLPLPATPADELALNEKVSRFLLQGVPLDGSYRH